MSKQKIVIVDADFGNIDSVENAIKHLGYNFQSLKKVSNLDKYSHLILPGVGSFNTASKKLQLSGWFDAIKKFASQSKPILGICLGMQLLFETSDENGLSQGLSFFKGHCKKFNSQNKLPLPHMGFNFVKHDNSKIWKDIPNPSPFYFIHNYRVKESDELAIASITTYGDQFISFIEKEKIFGAQFHPEKSHRIGLKLLKNFIELR
tara:strand:+ start:563 stop:1180 length:618 start_codon:yes stop_codon:yes gene_type:complete